MVLRGFVKLQHILVIPFVVLISLAIIFTGISTWKITKEYSMDLGEQISVQTAHRVEERLDSYFDHAYIANNGFRSVIKSNLIDLRNRQELINYFDNVTKNNHEIRTLGFGFADGSYFGAGHENKGSLVYKEASKDTNHLFQVYNMSTHELILNRSKYDVRVRPWFKEALTVDMPVWSSVYSMFSTKQLGITLSESIYKKNGELLGVIGTDVVFENLDDQLKAIKINEKSSILVLDDKKHVIAQSDERTKLQEKLERIDETNNDFYKQVANFYAQPNLNITINSSVDIQKDNQIIPYFVNYIPYQHNGFNWSILVLTPEDEFLGHVKQVRKNTIYLWGFGFLLALLMGVAITYFLSRAIKRIQKRILNMSNSMTQQEHMPEYIKEVEELSSAFTQMSKKLHLAYEKIQQSNVHLKEEVSDKNNELQYANQKLYELSNIDGLTGLSNRKSFEKLWNNFWQAFNKKEVSSLCLVLCNIDFFNKYNDSYGYQKGDECIQVVANIIKDVFSEQGKIARYGGSEFIIMLPDITTNEVANKIKQVQALLVNANLEHAVSEASDLVTLSMGVAITADSTNDKNQVLKNAEEALFQAKKQGRNQYFIHLTH